MMHGNMNLNFKEYSFKDEQMGDIYIKNVTITNVRNGQLDNCSERDIITRLYFLFMLYLATLSEGCTVEWSHYTY
jgi:hypothetical protein